MLDCLPPFVEGTALPQLKTRLLGDDAEMPKVSPGHTNELPKASENWTGSESQPRVTEKARRYSAYPCGLLSESQATYAIPAPPPATWTMCGTLRLSGVA